MLFLVTGASGVGKSTVRRLVAPRLGAAFEAIELHDLGAAGDLTIAWRQQMAELAARRAQSLAADGRHLLLSGDPVAAGEMIAAPSAGLCGGVAVCLLDADAETQRVRLQRRGDPAELLPHHLAFAQWMREHAVDPIGRIEVLTASAAPGAHWGRLAAAADGPARWHMRVIDTSDASPTEVGASVCEWIAAVLVDDSLAMHPELWSDDE